MRIESACRRQRTDLTEARNRAQNYCPIDRPEALETHTEPIGDTRLIVLHDDLGVWNKFEKTAAVGIVFQIEDKASLAPIEVHESIGLRAHAVTTRRFDLEHISAKVG